MRNRKMNTDENMNDDVQVMSLLQQSNRIKISKTISHNITVFLDDIIGSPSEYRDEIWTIINASEDDEVTVLLNTVGGNLSTALAIREALLMTQAQSTAIIINECSSAGTIIALSCDNVGVLNSAEFMIHTAKFMSGGNTNNVKDHVDFTHNQVHKLIDDVYSGFLTKDEIEKVKLGKEFWFDSEETKKRLLDRAKFIENKDKKSKKVKKETTTETAELLLG